MFSFYLLLLLVVCDAIRCRDGLLGGERHLAQAVHFRQDHLFDDHEAVAQLGLDRVRGWRLHLERIDGLPVLMDPEIKVRAG